MIGLARRSTAYLHRTYRRGDGVFPRARMRLNPRISGVGTGGIEPVWAYYWPSIEPGGIVRDLVNGMDLMPDQEFRAAGLPCRVRQHASGVVVGSVETAGSRAVYSSRPDRSRWLIPESFLMHVRVLVNSTIVTAGSTGRGLVEGLTDVTNPSVGTPALRWWQKAAVEVSTSFSTAGIFKESYINGGLQGGTFYDLFFDNGTNSGGGVVRSARFSGTLGQAATYTQSASSGGTAANGAYGYCDRLAFPHSLALYNAGAGYRLTTDATLVWSAFYKLRASFSSFSEAGLAEMCDLGNQIEPDPVRVYFDFGAVPATPYATRASRSGILGGGLH